MELGFGSEWRWELEEIYGFSYFVVSCVGKRRKGRKSKVGRRHGVSRVSKEL